MISPKKGVKAFSKSFIASVDYDPASGTPVYISKFEKTSGGHTTSVNVGNGELLIEHRLNELHGDTWDFNHTGADGAIGCDILAQHMKTGKKLRIDVKELTSATVVIPYGGEKSLRSTMFKEYKAGIEILVYNLQRDQYVIKPADGHSASARRAILDRLLGPSKGLMAVFDDVSHMKLKASTLTLASKMFRHHSRSLRSYLRSDPGFAGYLKESCHGVINDDLEIIDPLAYFDIGKLLAEKYDVVIGIKPPKKKLELDGTKTERYGQRINFVSFPVKDAERLLELNSMDTVFGYKLKLDPLVWYDLKEGM